MSGSVSPLPWTGNKGCIYTTIDAFMPPHRTYVEACMGSAEVFLRKKPVEKEIINDYNGDLVRFFRVLQRNENLERLIGRLFLSFNSEQIFRANKALLAEVPNILDDLTETSVIIENTQWNDFDLAVAFYENQVFSFSSTGKNFAITKKDMTKRFGRLIAACARLRNATIMHRDYKDCISYGAGEDAFILLDPPYKGTEDYYQKSSFGSDEHAKLFGFMNEVHEQFHGSCKFLITYNNDPYIRELADHYGFDTFVQERLHNASDDIKLKLGEKIVKDQYGSIPEIVADIRQMTYDAGPVKRIFYCPLVGNIEDGYDDTFTVGSSFLRDYAWAIEDAIEKDRRLDDQDMAQYFHEDAGLKDKLASMVWGVEVYRGELFGKIECSLKEEMTPAEEEILKDYITGQNSDGWGEHFEQQPIDTEDGDLYVSFWNSGDDYAIMTQDELDAYIESQGMKMGGM